MRSGGVYEIGRCSLCRLRRAGEDIVHLGAEASPSCAARPNSSQNRKTKASSTSANGTERPSSASSDVTPWSAIPQGTMRRKKSRSVFTLNANPWLVTQREMRTPMAPIFSGPRGVSTHAPDSPLRRAGRHAEIRAHADHQLLEVPHVRVHVAPIRLEVDHRVAHELPRAVVGHVAAAPRLVHLDAAGRQHLRRRDDVRAGAVRFHAERDDVRVLEQEKDVGGSGPPSDPRRVRAAARAPQRRTRRRAGALR